MTEQEIIQNNILIAEFIGFEMTHKINYVPSKYPNYMKNVEHLRVDNIDNLPFHTSWDWLMPVVNKCSQEAFNLDLVFNTELWMFNTNEISSVYDEVLVFIRKLYTLNHLNKSLS